MDSNEPKLTPFHFETPDRPDKEWEDWFREFHARKVMKVEFNPDPDTPLHLAGSMLMLPGAAISDMSSSPGVGHQHDVTDSDDIFLVTVTSGESATLHRGEHVRIGGGVVALGRADLPGYMKVQTASNFVTVRLTRRMLEPLVPDLSDKLSFSYFHDSPAMRLLLAYAGVLMSGQIGGGPELQHLVSTHVHDLAALALGAGREGTAVAKDRGARAARLAAVKADILQELANPNLSVPMMAARHGVSPRYIHMLFEAEGATFSEYVVGQRLTRAHRHLNDPRFSAHAISEIALLVGFGDLSYFNRTFRRRFGRSPSDVRAAARNGQ